MPDFRARVHRGETFVIAGDRFAIGSSREMSPAGLKGVAEEVGLELVVVCGHNMGDIFRRNSFNLGLHVVQSPEAVADAQDGDEFSFDPVTRAAAQRDAGQDLRAGAALARRKRRSAAAAASSRSAGASSARRSMTAPAIDWPDAERRARHDDDRADRLGAPRRQGPDAADLKPGATLRVYADLLPASDGTAPFAIHTFNQITGGDTIYPRQAAIANDHFVFTGVDADDKQTAIGREFARVHGHREAVLRDAGRRHLPLLFSRAGAGACRASSFPGADSHSRAYGAYGAVGIGVGSTTLGFGWSTGYIYFTLAQAAPRRVHAAGCSRGSAARTSSSSCCGDGARSSRRACRWSSSTPTGSCRSRTATRSRT